MLNIPNLVIKSDSDGHYTTEKVLMQIKKANEDLQLGIDFPNKPFSEICLADLKCDGLPCTYSFSEGIVWDDELGEYTERNMTLCFG